MTRSIAWSFFALSLSLSLSQRYEEYELWMEKIGIAPEITLGCVLIFSYH